MKLIDLLNEANCGKKIPMYVWDIYNGREGNYKQANFFIDSFDWMTVGYIKRHKLRTEYKRELVTIDHIIEQDRELCLIIKLNCGTLCKHRELMNCLLRYDTIQLNKDLEIIGAAKYGRYIGPKYEIIPYLFSELTDDE